LAVAALAAIAGCGGSSSGAASASRSITTTGGEGLAGDGGDGGAVAILGLVGEDVAVLRGGAVDVAFTLPADPPSLGANPLVVSADARITVDENGHVSGTAIPTATATGLHILGGATLTLDFALGGEELELPSGAIIEGTLSLGAREVEIGVRGLHVAASGAIVAEGAPADPSSPEGADGGIIDIESSGTVVVQGQILARGRDGATGGRGGAIGIEVGVISNIYCTGTLDASGGAGREADGGEGGEISLRAATSEDGTQFGGVLSSGVLRARGGEGAGAGGPGGSILLEAGAISGEFGSVGNVTAGGEMDASGGDGLGISTTGDGRSGGGAGRVIVFAALGEVRVAGTIAARGGDGAPVPEASGGDGGFVLVARGHQLCGPLEVGADFDTRGGSGGRGGQGGAVQIGARFDEDEGNEGAEVDDAPQEPRADRQITLRGYSQIEASGGASAGGRGGDAAAGRGGKGDLIDLRGIMRDPGVGAKAIASESGGRLRFEADIVARGGAAREVVGEGGRGGRGAGVMLMLEDRRRIVRPEVSADVASTGAIDARGGDGVRGGRAGVVAIASTAITEESGVANLSPLRAVTLEGRIDLTGGAGEAGTTLVGAGGAGGVAIVLSVPGGAVTALAGIDASGGACPGARGGDGGAVVLVGGATILRADLSCDGGAGAIGGAGGRGVDTGVVATVVSQQLPSPLDIDDPGDIEDGTDDQSRTEGGVVLHGHDAPTSAAGRVSAAGGRGTSVDGASGTIIVDGVVAETSAGVEVLP